MVQRVPGIGSVEPLAGHLCARGTPPPTQRMRIPRGWLRALGNEAGQDAFEYLLASGLVAVVVALAFYQLDFVIPQVVGFICPAVDTATGSAVGACIGP